MARILTTVALLVAVLALSGCGMPYGYGGLGGYGADYGGGYGYAPGYGGYAGAQSYGGGVGLPIPALVAPGYSGGYVQQPYYQGQTYPYGTYPGQSANNQYQTGNQTGNSWTYHNRSGQTPNQPGTPNGTTGTTGILGTTGTTGTTETTDQASSQQQNQLNNANNGIANANQSSLGQLPGTSQYANPNQRTPGMVSSPQMSQGSGMGYNQSMGGYRSPMAQAPMQARAVTPMVSAPRVSAPAPRAAVSAARPAQAGARRGPGQ